MSMQENENRRGAGGAEIGPRGSLPAGGGKPMLGLALCLALSLLTAGCAAIGSALGPSARARDVSIAFESIDGLPRDVSQKLVRDLDEEAAALRIAVVPAGAEAAYRVRGYLAAHAEGATTVIAWAWDVYDGELHRAFRLNGEERVSAAAGRNHDGGTWATADEALLRRIARTGMEQLADFMASASAPAAPTPAAPGRGGGAVASRDDSRSGSFRSETLAAVDSFAIPLPRRRPALAGLTGTTRLADAAFGR
jgi:hypothetical protein